MGLMIRGSIGAQKKVKHATFSEFWARRPVDRIIKPPLPHFGECGWRNAIGNLGHGDLCSAPGTDHSLR